MSEREHLRAAIAGIEAQRATLGDAAVEAALAALKTRLEALDRRAEPSDAMRKYATVLFADVVGFTAMSEQMDPEEVRDAMNRAWTLVDDAITRHGGHIDKHIGDAVMAVFGVPTSREDDTLRAVLAALDMQAALRDVTEALGRDDVLSMRVGLHTGLVAWGRVGTTGEESAMGNTVNLASRIEQAAPPGGIVISEASHRHVRGVFEVHALPPRELKGQSVPVTMVQVLGVRSGARRRMIPTVTGVDTPLLGRDAELAALGEVYDRVASGAGAARQVVLGEAGVGKSRLLFAFIEELSVRDEPAWLLRGRTEPGTATRPFGLLRDILTYRCGLDEDEAPCRQRQKLVVGLTDLMGADAERIAPYLAHLIGIADPDDVRIRGYADAPKELFALAADALVRCVALAAERAPAVMVLEDVHQADAATLALIDRVFDLCASSRLFILASARPALDRIQPGWCAPEGHVLRLADLPREAAVALVRHTLDRASALDEAATGALAERLASQAAGNPFFLEELVQLLLERGQLGADALDAPVPVPGTVQAVLQARLDTLSPDERRVVEHAAVAGEAFSPAAVAGVGEDDELAVEPALAGLRARELIRPVAGGRAERYAFKHALLREVVYEMIPLRRRADRHRWMARWLMADTEDAAGRASKIAFHLDACGETREAAAWHLEAGRRAHAAGAVMLAADHYQKGIEAGRGTLGRREQLEALADLGNAWDLAGRRAEAEAACTRLAELAGGEARWEATALLESARIRLGITGDPEDVDASIRRARRAAERADDPDLLGRVSELEARLAYHRGDPATGARICAERLGDGGLADTTRARLSIRRGWCLYRLGRLEEAGLSFDDAQSRAEAACADRLSRQARQGRAAVLRGLGKADAARCALERLLAEARGDGNRQLEAVCLTELGESHRHGGDLEGARACYTEALSIDEAIRGVNIPVNRLNLALCDLESGAFDASLRRLDAIEPPTWLKEWWLSVRIACAAALGNAPRFDEDIAELSAGLSRKRTAERDIAALAERAGDAWANRDDRGRAAAAYELAASQWCALGQPDDVTRVEARRP